MNNPIRKIALFARWLCNDALADIDGNTCRSGEFGVYNQQLAASSPAYAPEYGGDARGCLPTFLQLGELPWWKALSITGSQLLSPAVRGRLKYLHPYDWSGWKCRLSAIAGEYCSGCRNVSTEFSGDIPTSAACRRYRKQDCAAARDLPLSDCRNRFDVGEAFSVVPGCTAGLIPSWMWIVDIITYFLIGTKERPLEISCTTIWVCCSASLLKWNIHS